MSRYRLSRLAQADLDNIWLYIASRGSVGGASRVIHRITEVFPVLARMPRTGRSRDDIAPDVSSFPVDHYLIYYRTNSEGGIQISRIIHRLRDQRKAWRDQSDER